MPLSNSPSISDVADILKNFYEGLQEIVKLVIVALELAAALCNDFIKTPWTFAAADDVRLSRTNNSKHAKTADDQNMRTAVDKSKRSNKKTEKPKPKEEEEEVSQSFRKINLMLLIHSIL